ncbi:RNA-dependent RNA polymerase [Saesbyeol virus]|uniref:RNA-dependent RNA polymerase n=1 Tax=Saesbyeol virus TaxID=2320522 RepID=UPI000EB76336|nr:RNA-dependent RNA polymerase [Saesbyeol virus]AXY66749.1 RNA-dependent RNA polymerase [Saesbyeol virus]
MIEDSNPHIRVVECNFIFDRELSTLGDIMQFVQNTFMCGWTSAETTKFRKDIQLLNDRILDIERNVTDKDQYLMYKDQQNSPNHTDGLLESLLDKTPETGSDYCPVSTEFDLFIDAYRDSQSLSRDTVMMTEIKDLSDIRETLNTVNDTEFAPRTPRSPLQYVFNLDAKEDLKGLALLESYHDDIAFNASSSDPERELMLSILPHSRQIKTMKAIDSEYRSRKTLLRKETTEGKFTDIIKKKYGQKMPYYSPQNAMASCGPCSKSLLTEYVLKSRRINEKKQPESIPSEYHEEAKQDTESLIKYLSMQTKSNSTSSNLGFDVPSGTRRDRELESIGVIKPIYDTINKSRGAILASCIVKWINDIVRIKIGASHGIYYSVPIQCNMIFCTLTGRSMYGNNPHYNYFSIARFRRSNDDEEMFEDMTRTEINTLFKGQVRCTCETRDYIYVVSKLNKTALDKLEKIITVDHEFRTHAMSMAAIFIQSNTMTNRIIDAGNEYHPSNFTNTAEYIDAMSKSTGISKVKFGLEDYLEKYIGGSSLIMLDLHQKPSELLDLLKYLSGINFSEISNIRNLLNDKMAIMLKTSLDVWLRDRMLDYCSDNISLARYCKPSKVLMSEKGILPSSFNVTGLFTSFWAPGCITDSLTFYYSEAQLVFQSRPKKLYNDQYMAKSCLKVLENNKKMREEELDGQPTNGVHDPRSFDFSSKFGYSKDAVWYAQDIMNRESMRLKDRHRAKILGKLEELAVSNVSMRGACKLEENIKQGEPKSQTSLYSCLEYLEKDIMEGNTDNCRLVNVVRNSQSRTQAFNMSAKEQRGGGRPIGSPDYPSKQQLYLNESVYKILSSEQNENMLVKGVNRSAKIASINRKVVTDAYSKGYKHIRHIVMDQSQFSEGDNVNKFIDAVKFNSNIPPKVKTIMIKSEEMHMARHQYWPVMPNDAEDNFGSDILSNNGTLGKAGWVQGMKNIASTYLHIASVKWIIKSFNDFYFEMPGNEVYSGNKIMCEQIVNSDDSYCIVAHSHVKPIHDFYYYMQSAKRYFRLEQNKKKSYATRTIGEIIQKYVANGTVINIWAKLAVSSFRNNMGVDLCRDVSNSVAQLGNLLREGAPENICVYVRAELKNQIFKLYNIGDGKFNDLKRHDIDITLLPCELGGWPGRISTFELCISGTQAQLEHCKSLYKLRVGSNEEKIVRTSITLNMKRVRNKETWAARMELLKTQNPSDIDPAREDLDDIKLSAKLYQDIEMIEKELDNDAENELINQLREMHLEPELVVANSTEITVTSEGLSSFDGSFARSTINSINWIINVPKKISRTLTMLDRFSSLTPSGLAGLFKERNSIQTAIADLKDQSNSMIIMLSELNYTRSLRQKAAANAYAATQKCCTVGGIPKKLSITGAYTVLLRLHERLSQVHNINISSDFLERVLSDPTGRAKIAHYIITNYVAESRIDSEGSIANEIPKSEDDIDVSNDIQSILVEIARPGYLKTQGYTFKNEARMKSDCETILNIYIDWFNAGTDILNVVRTIYFHHINVRRNRYIIAPPLNRRTQMEYITSVYEKCQFLGVQIIGCLSTSGCMPVSTISKTVSDAKDITNNLMGALEVVLFMNKCYGMDMRETFADIKCDGIQIASMVDSVRFGEVFNHADSYSKRYLATLAHLATGTDVYIREVTKLLDFNIHWIKEQERRKLPDGKNEYFGPFEVMISKGLDALVIKGSPGDIETVTTNTLKVNKIVELLHYFITRTPFPGYRKPSSFESWGNSTFWNSRNSGSKLRLIYGRNNTTRIEKSGNPFKEVAHKGGFSLTEDDAGTILLRAMTSERDIVTYIPLEYSYNMETPSSSHYQYTRYEVEGNKCYGHRHETRIFIETDPLMGTKKQTKRFESVRVLLFNFKDAHHTTNYRRLSFSYLTLDGLSINALSSYGLLKKVILGELVKSSRSTVLKFIMDEVPPSKIILNYAGLLITRMDNRVKLASEAITSALSTVEIGLALGPEPFEGLEEPVDQEDYVDQIEDEYDIGVNIKIAQKDITNILIELSTLTLDPKRARYFITATLRSRFTQSLLSIIHAVTTASQEGHEVDNDARSMLECMYEAPIDNLTVESRGRNRRLLKSVISCIVKYGLMAKNIWECKSIRTLMDEHRKTGWEADDASDGSEEDDEIVFMTESTTSFFNMLYKCKIGNVAGRDSESDDDSQTSEDTSSSSSNLIFA